MNLKLRYMTLEDVPEVINIDRLSFETPWSARSYQHEVTESSYSYMTVLEHITEGKPASGFRRILQNLSPAPPARRIVAYGGLWHIAGEAHISTIASHPDTRGKGYGEIVLAGMVRRSVTLDADYIVLEVRVSNIPAQNLYKKYGFEVVDVKPRYYHNNGEDAYDMRLNLKDETVRQQIHTHFSELMRKRWFEDFYTDVRPPRG